MVSIASETRNPSWCPQPAAYRTRCPECGAFSPFGAVCQRCLDTMVAVEKTVANICPCCHHYSPFSVLCGTCAATLTEPTQVGVYTAMEPTADAQLILYADRAAPPGLCDVQLYVGPDAVAADEVLTPSEYVLYLHRAIAHLQSYVCGYEAAMRTEHA